MSKTPVEQMSTCIIQQSWQNATLRFTAGFKYFIFPSESADDQRCVRGLLSAHALPKGFVQLVIADYPGSPLARHGCCYPTMRRVVLIGEILSCRGVATTATATDNRPEILKTSTNLLTALKKCRIYEYVMIELAQR